MTRSFALGLALAGGAALATQAPANAALARSIGPMRAALVNNAICFGLMVVIVLVTAGGSTGVVADRVPWHYIGGLAGTAIVIITLLAVRPLGATALTVAVVTGQLLLATLIDRFGWLGLEVHTITLPRAAGLGLVVAGLALIAKG